ncbi:MAG: YfiR family protein [Candidatus Eisenbacteria bacterium]
MKRLISLILVLPITATLLGETRALADKPSEYEIKAAFLYNFAKFVKWPHDSLPEPDSPIVIGVLGKDPFGPVLDEIVRDKPIDGRPIRVKRLTGPRDAAGIQILFVSITDEAELARAFKEIEPRGMLVVGETKEFAHDHGTVRFFLEENRVRFEINVAAADRAGIKIDVKLLKLARVIGNGKEGGR